MKLRYFKSAVAFFFLFFLYGTSIDNGQQGISYNYSIGSIKLNQNYDIINNLRFKVAIIIR